MQMGRFVWIVSYPRSGNTFLRALLTAYLKGVSSPLHLEDLPRFSVGESDEALWTDLTGEQPGSRRLESQWRARADYISSKRAALGPNHGIFKSHTPNAMIFGTPAFAFSSSDRVVHVIRNPCDVAVSTSAYYGLSLDDAIAHMMKENTLIDARPRGGFEVIGSWAQHALSWMRAVPVPVHRVRYHELTTDTAEILGGVVRFLGLPFDRERVDAAVAACSFNRLAQQEREAGFAEGVAATSGGFFRVGRPLQFLETMDPMQIDRIVLPLRAVLEDVGLASYLRRNGVNLG